MPDVLCAHTSAAFVEELRRHLEGVALLDARTGDEAVELLRGARPDLVVVGLAAAEARRMLVRARESGATTPVLLLSDEPPSGDAGLAAILPGGADAARVALAVRQLLGSAPPECDAFAAIDAAQREFAAAAAQRVAELLEETGRLLDGPSPAAFERLRALAHQTAGTLGSYGYDAPGEVAGRIEDAALAADPPAIAELGRLRDELAALLPLSPAAP